MKNILAFGLSLGIITMLAMATPDYDKKILQNIRINGVDMGDISGYDALELLETSCPIGEQKITIDGQIYIFADFGAGYDFATAVDEALAFSDCGGFFDRLKKKRALRSSPLEIYANFIYDEDRVAEAVAQIAASRCINPIDAGYTLEDGRFVIIGHKMGQEVDTAALQAQIIQVLLSCKGGDVVLPLIPVAPRLKEADFAISTQLLGSFTTPFDPSRTERAVNLSTANNYLNNQTILPGETMSVCRVLRPRILENGYVEAGQIINGLPSSGIGGGICQISSTLYMAALYAELDIVERRNHSLMVAYAGPATDATLAEGAIDLKIRNSTAFPMLVQSVLSSHGHTVNIYGHESRPNGRHITFEAVLIETMPYDDKFVEDAALPPNYSQIASFGMDGAKYELYKVVAENGEAKRTKVNTSTYRPLQRIIKIGVQPDL
ncbi:MAG: VanW family protein [Defluviitaleaceae bacterium]|nr:VanW family protein [Defluviitaleaceae bacterium]